MPTSSDSGVSSASAPMTEWDFLDEQAMSVETRFDCSLGPTPHESQNAPLTMYAALEGLKRDAPNSQYGLFGQVITSCSRGTYEAPSDKRLYMNCSAPFSALLCGVQGAGKSHTLSTMLENLLIPRFKPIGSLSSPMSALVLHFGEGGSSSLPSEVAWLASAPRDLALELPKVRVFVSASSVNTMRSAYAGALGDKVEVYPLYFTESELDAQAILSMMSVSSSSSAPLYMHLVLSKLRELGEHFTLHAFQKELEDLKEERLNPVQRAGLEQRLALLNSFMDPIPANKQRKKRRRFAPGQLTIIDLSDPFIDADSACGVFNIVSRLFTRAEMDVGKVLVIDEAHKYLSNAVGSSELTQRILSIIRQQRHLGMRVIISTQEPTILPPVIIDLCTVIILHRFQSPAWWDHIVKHVSADFSLGDAFDQVVRLQTGQSVVFAPSGIGKFKGQRSNGDETSATADNNSGLRLFGRRYLICQTRKRLTKDGGASILATRSSK
ncbi:hypothetical protein P691DRAFT_807247 [Macrolepiota fuliginosa MF-IS2]|uniref:AAA+ ATPase domain-containing protein n=1 Tax=Macrolepiota fuliginosa MF-IS2 TaxID=1400762 RepID=A0A9P6C7V0_9AGAR|nr:hypothetical protein P691DRAFT_807247 [Macrolepiota fuliginosa MF-IS2]